jgi:hypothetical protein
MHIKFWLHNLKGISFGRPRYSWDDDTKMNLMKALWKALDWTDLAHNRGW